MATLDSFIMEYTLKGADKVIKQNKEIEKTSDNLEKKTKQTEKASFNLNDMFKKLATDGMSSLIKKSAILYASYKLFNKVIENTLKFSNEADELDFLSKKAGTTIENLQAISKASGATSQEVAGVFENVNQELQGLRKGQNSQLLTDMAVKYGISFVGENGLKTSEQIIDNVAKQFSNLNTASQIDLANMLGLDDKTTKLMMKGYNEYKKAVDGAKKFNVFDKKYIENSKKLLETLREIKNQFYFIAGTIARITIPVINVFSKIFSKVISLFIDNKGAVMSMILAISIALRSKLLLSAKTLIPTFITLGKTIWASMAPLLPIIALITFLFLLIQDIYGWVTGQDSLLGHLFGDFDEVKEKLLKFIGNIKGWFIDLFLNLKETFMSFIDGILHPIEKIKKWFGKGKKDNTNENYFEKAQEVDKIFNQGTNTINNQSSMNNNYNNKNANLKVDNIIINTSNNSPQEISKSVENSLEDTIININDAMI